MTTPNVSLEASGSSVRTTQASCEELSTDRIGPLFIVLIGSVAFAPYFIWTHILLGAPTLFGKSLILSILTTVVCTAFVLNGRYIFTRIGGPFLLVCTTLVVIFALRTILYKETLADVVEGREGFFYFIYISLFLPFIKSERHWRLIKRVILWTCFIQAVVGIIHNYFFSYVVTGIALDDSGRMMYILDPGQGGFRENGTVISSNTYGSLLVLGMILMAARKKQWSLRSVAPVGLYLGLCFWGVVLSGSRFALFAAILVMAYYVWTAAPRAWSLVLLVLLVASVLSSTLLDRAKARFEHEGSGGRGAKTQVVLDLSVDNASNFFVGVPKSVLGQTQTPEGLLFSDDSYAKLLADYGAVGAFVIIMSACLLWGMLVRVRGWIAVCLLFLSVQFLVTNAVIWDWWLIYAGATVLVLNAERLEGLTKRSGIQRPVLKEGYTHGE